MGLNRLPKSKLPVVLSIPHGGIAIPKEAKPSCKLNLEEILADGDTWTGQIYGESSLVAATIFTSVPRAVVDMNRDPADLPPANFDGVVKTVTVDQRQVWLDPQGPSEDLQELLLKKYHSPYHEAIATACKRGGMELGLDCHTMLAQAPLIAPVPGVVRPLICISNRGDKQGLARGAGEPITADPQLLLAFKDALARVFAHQDVELELNQQLIQLNEPFAGGYITRHHGTNSGIPWIQIEFSKALYLTGETPMTAEPTGESARRVKNLRHKFFAALAAMWD